MASLLGGQVCMESLQKDVTDLQTAINDVFSRVGPVRYPSWKYPDKMSCDLDVEDLLSLHSYSSDFTAEEKQMSHVVLYELVIDRLVLLLQGMSKYTENLLLMGKSPSGSDTPSHTSVGLVVKRYWQRLVQTHALCTHLNSQCRSKDRKISQLQDSVVNTSDESINRREGGTGSQIGFGGLVPPSSAELHSVLGTPISHDCCHKAAQTLETAFVPCESCYYVQRNLRETGDCVVNMCQSQGLPSSLQKFKPLVVDNDWFTANEVSQWNSEQIKDLNRITKHLDQLSSTSENLKSELKDANLKCEKLQEKVETASKEVKLEKETQQGMSVQFEQKVTSLKTQHAEDMAVTEKEKNKLTKNKAQLENQLENYKSELLTQKEQLVKLKEIQVSLQEELEVSQSKVSDKQALEVQVNALTSQLQDLTSDLEVKSSMLAKEQARYQSVSKHSQSLQNKQGSLLSQLEELGQENEDLKGQVNDLEETKENLEETIQSSKEKLAKLSKQADEDKLLIKKLGEEKVELERSMSETERCLREVENKLEETRQQQQLMVEYPDLNGPVQANLHSTGDILVDMERQIEANSMRIHILEEQNDTFRNSIKKMLESRENSRQQPSQPIPLWKSSGLGTLTEDPDSHRDNTVNYKSEWSIPVVQQTIPNYHGNQIDKNSKLSSSKSSLSNGSDSFLVSRGSRPNSASRRGTPSRPPSGGKSGQYNGSVGVYKQLKNGGKLNREDVKPDIRTTESNRPRSSQKATTFTCQLCDKMYSREKDLTVHKSYCTG